MKISSLGILGIIQSLEQVYVDDCNELRRFNNIYKITAISEWRIEFVARTGLTGKNALEVLPESNLHSLGLRTLLDACKNIGISATDLIVLMT